MINIGARILRVDADGEVTLFCLAAGHVTTVRVPAANVGHFGALVGRAVTLSISCMPPPEVYECAECAAKPGSRRLCSDCVERRKRAGSAWIGTSCPA